MKIEDSPYHFSGSPALDKLRRNAYASSLENALDEFDLSFLDLLTSVAEVPPPAGAPGKPALEKAHEKEKTAGAKSYEGPPKLTLVSKAHADSLTEPRTEVDKAMSLLKDDLTASDLQYLKQAVIPGLPILMGSVPFNSVFPAGEDGTISYQGFDVSGKLSELIEKGYKTGRPIRVELDHQSAVVLKIRNGQVSAEFVSTNQAAGLAMQQDLDELRNRMAARNLPVGSLEYKYQNPHQSRQERRRQDEETPSPAEQ